MAPLKHPIDNLTADVHRRSYTEMILDENNRGEDEKKNAASSEVYFWDGLDSGFSFFVFFLFIGSLDSSPLLSSPPLKHLCTAAIPLILLLLWKTNVFFSVTIKC